MRRANGKREQILDAMRDLMADTAVQSVSVSDIAQRAGIGKGSIYYYFKSKEEILEAVMERAYFSAIDQCKMLVNAEEMDAFQKMELIFRVCREASLELSRQEPDDFFGVQQRALIHQKFVRVLVSKLQPILADVIRQGTDDALFVCGAPDEIAELVVLVLAVKLDNQLLLSNPLQIASFMAAFCALLEKGMEIPNGRLDYLKISPNG